MSGHPSDHAEWGLEGARHLSSYLGKRMRAVKLMNKSDYVRELLLQDLKLEVEKLTRQEALGAARYLAAMAGKAHSRQMDDEARTKSRRDLNGNRSKSWGAPNGLWTSVLGLLAEHERAYLEHCRTLAAEMA
jgi:uncharacterized protein (DUF2252 family)